MLFSNDAERANEPTASTALATPSGGACPATSKCERTPLMTSRVASSMPASRPLAKYDRAEDQLATNNNSSKTTITVRISISAPHQNPTDARPEYQPRMSSVTDANRPPCLMVERVFPSARIMAD